MARGQKFTRVRVSITVPVSKADVWEELRQIERHPLWMKDAVSIRFTSEQREGIGTSFICKTKVGPFRTNDVMEVTDWVEGRLITVHHRGLFTGAGRFTLRGEMGLHCVIRWEERLKFPIYLGGSITGFFAKPILKSIWQRNLARLGALVEYGYDGGDVDDYDDYDEDFDDVTEEFDEDFDEELDEDAVNGEAALERGASPARADEH